MGLDKVTLGGITILGWLIYSYVLYPFYLSPFAKIPGPKLAAMTSAWITWVDFGGKRSETIDKLHRKHGKVVRVGPNELSFTGMEAMQKIYGAGTTFSKAAYFYNIFMAYEPLETSIDVGMVVDRCLLSWIMRLMLPGRNYFLRFIRNHL